MSALRLVTMFTLALSTALSAQRYSDPDDSRGSGGAVIPSEVEDSTDG